MSYPDKETKMNRSYSRLRRLIQEYHFPPGMHLQITHLSDFLNVSVTPIREALVRLECDRLIEFKANKGYYIKYLTVSEQQNVLDMQYKLTIISLKEIKSKDVHIRLEFDPDASPLSKLLSIKQQICGSTRNREIVEFMDLLTARIYFVLKVDCDIRASEYEKYIGSLTDAMTDGDYDRVMAIVNRHNNELKSRLFSLLSECAARAGLKRQEDWEPNSQSVRTSKM